MSTELSAGSTLARSTGASSNTRKDVTTNYEVDRSIRHVQQGAGGIKRLSVAVVVNYRGATGAQGKRAAQALTAAELEQIKNLASQAMGFSAERGDSLNVVNSPFASDASDAPELPIWRQPDNIEMAKAGGKYLLLGILALYLWFAVLRPLLRKHLHPVPAQAAAPGREEAPSVDAVAQSKERQAERHLENIRYAQETAAKEPRAVAMLIKHWMGEKNV